jgi:hypothetical protein
MSVYNPFLGMLLNFNINGYLPYFLPVIAHCGRIHENQHGQLIHDEGLRTLILYRKLIAGYFFDVLFGRKAHCFRDGNSLVIGRLSRKERMYLPVDLVRHKLHLLMARTFRSRAIGKAMRRLLAS